MIRKTANSKKTLKSIIKIIIFIIILFTFYIFGFATGVSNSIIPEGKLGTYNIDIYQGGKVVVTTKIQYIEYDDKDNKLIIHGMPVHEPIND